MSENIVALVDCNSFYCSCERVFRPSLHKMPVIVLSNNDGCVVARTDEAKAIGIKMGEPFFKIKELCKKNKVSVFSSNYGLYGDMSRRVMRTLSEFTPEMEIYSIDEAFLSLNGFKKETLKNYGLKIRKTINQYTGIPVSVGIGSTKVLAKVANHYAKKNKAKTDGVVNLFEYPNIDNLLREVPVEDIWGIGRQSASKLNSIKVKNACDLKYSNERVIQQLLTITGRRIVEELRGISCITLDLAQADKKQIISSRSFGKPVFKLDELKEAVANHVSTSAEKLRKQRCITKALVVFVHTNRFKNTQQYFNSITINLLSGTSATNKLIHAAMTGLEQIFKPDIEYKKAGVMLIDIQKKSHSQLDLFNQHDSAEDDLLMETLDKVNAIQGKGTLKFAACGIDQFWKMLSQMKSPNYSTRWSDLLKIR